MHWCFLRLSANRKMQPFIQAVVLKKRFIGQKVMDGNQRVQAWLSACNTGIVSSNHHKAYYICTVYRHPVLTYVYICILCNGFRPTQKAPKPAWIWTIVKDIVSIFPFSTQTAPNKGNFFPLYFYNDPSSPKYVCMAFKFFCFYHICSLCYISPSLIIIQDT